MDEYHWKLVSEENRHCEVAKLRIKKKGGGDEKYGPEEEIEEVLRSSGTV